MKLKKYYVTGNTAEGYVNYLSSNLKGIKETIQLEHASYQANTEVIKQLLENNRDKTTMEVLKNPISQDYLDGIIFREKELAILGILDQPFTEQAYKYFENGLRIHDDLEKVYINEMDFDKADQLAKEFSGKLLANSSKKERTPVVFRRMFGTNTVDGVVNEVPDLTKNLREVYHIKGRAGTGKSTFMKRIADACLDYGFDLEIYHCSFDPNSIDMVLVPELEVCLFDSTDPHAFHPKDEKREKVIDLYELAVTPGTDEKYEKEISKLTKEYKSYMKKGLEVIRKEGEGIIKADREKNVTPSNIEETIQQIQLKLD